MPKRKYVFSNGEYYHVFNRSIARMPLFSVKSDYTRFLDMVDYYRFADTLMSFSRLKNITRELRLEILSKLKKENNLAVEVLAFCLMNNHYHFLVKQVSEKGIVNWMSNIQNGYAKYFNIKTKRTGPLFQPIFQAVRIETDEQLLHVSRYIHLNPSTSFLVTIENLPSYEWSSLSYYLENKSELEFIDTKLILTLIKDKENYRKFVFNQASYQRELAAIKHLALDL